MTQQNLTRDQLVNRVKERLTSGDMTQDQARKVLEAWKQQQNGTEAPRKVQPSEGPSMQQAQPQPEPEAKEEGGGVLAGMADFFTGSQRTTTQIEETPGLLESGIISDQPLSTIAKLSAATQFTNDPNELAQIFTEQVPGLKVQYQLDAEGNPYPILVDNKGREAIVDKPGIDLLNTGQFISQLAAFTPAGRASSIPAAIGREALTEATIQGGQAAMGGEFDESQVAMAGALGGGGKAVEKGIGAVYRGITQSPSQATQDVLQAGRRFDVPVTTTDVVPPKTAAGRAGQVMAETVPLVGTGGMRATQQEARETAAREFVDRFQGGNYEGIVQSLKNQRNRIQKAAGQTYDRLVPALNEASQQRGGIPFDNTKQAMESAYETLTRPGRETSQQALDLLERIGNTIEGPGQTFGTVKDNIGAWTEALNSIDPAVRSQLSTNDKRQLQKVLQAMRQDRDDFAKQVLDESDYRKLKRADVSYGEMAQNLKETRIKGILDKGDVTPEVARNMLFSSKESEVRNLYRSLDTEGRNNARAVIIGDIVDRLSRRASGFTPDALATELNRNRMLTSVFFRDDRRRELEGLANLLEATRRAQRAEASFTAPTGERAIPYLVGAGTVIEPSVAAAFGSVGALGRLYERPEVRTVLSRMAAVEPGTTGFEKLINKYQQAVQAAAQATKSEEE